MKRLISLPIIMVLLSASIFSVSVLFAADNRQQPQPTTEDRVEDLLAQMTLMKKSSK